MLKAQDGEKDRDDGPYAIDGFNTDDHVKNCIAAQHAVGRVISTISAHAL